MRKIKVLSIFGTRPEGIKMVQIIKELERDEKFESKVCITAQHREMLDSVLDMFKINVDYDLDIMKHGQTIVDISNKVLEGVDNVIKIEKPDIVLVHGDTSTTLNAALAAFYNKVKIGHVEAGLRSNNKYSPFPEEINRKLTSSMADFHFAPTEDNKMNLLKENIEKNNIYVTGNTVIDALLSVIDNKYKFTEETLNEIDYEKNKVILVTTHRRENWGKPMEDIFLAIEKTIEKYENVKFIFPMHKNPAIRELAYKYFAKYEGNIELIEPLEYMDFANLMAKVNFIMTDSGGIQEEAPALGKPVLVLRTETERPEAAQAGTIKIVGIEHENILKEIENLIEDKELYEKMSTAKNPYGDGTAARKILNIIYENL